MRSKSISRSLRLFFACALGGGMFLTGCTLGDIRSNLVAGTLTYVRNSANTLWSEFLPVDEWATNTFGE